MLKNSFEGEAMIFKNSNGFYSMGMSSKKQDGSYDNAYINVRFKKGIELETKTKINIKKAWLTFNKYQNKNTGKEETNWYVFISDFDIEGNEVTSDAQNTNQDDDLPF